jgi:hypothetical protein
MSYFESALHQQMSALLRVWWLIFLQVVVTPLTNKQTNLASETDQDQCVPDSANLLGRYFGSVKLRVDRAQLIVDGMDWSLV